MLDINCEDPILRKACRGKLNALQRLPLYLCARCLCELSYLVDREGNVKIIQTRYPNPGSEQYSDYPDSFPRIPVALDSSIPASLPKIIEKWNVDVDLKGEKLSKDERELLEEFFGHPIFVPRYMYHHQLGGESLWEAWDENAFYCPNKQCPSGMADEPMQRGRPMKFLAGILNDPPGGLPLIEPLTNSTSKNWNYFVSFYFQICDKCLTVTAFSAWEC